MSVVQVSAFVPPSDEIDLTQETTYPLINTVSLLYANSMVYEPTPSAYAFKGQDLVYNNWAAPNPTGVELYVLNIGSKAASPSSLELLGAISSPHIVIPQQ